MVSDVDSVREVRIDDRLTQLLDAWRRDVEAEALPAPLSVAAMRRRWLAQRAPLRRTG